MRKVTGNVEHRSVNCSWRSCFWPWVMGALYVPALLRILYSDVLQGIGALGPAQSHLPSEVQLGDIACCLAMS